MDPRMVLLRFRELAVGAWSGGVLVAGTCRGFVVLLASVWETDKVFTTGAAERHVLRLVPSLQAVQRR